MSASKSGSNRNHNNKVLLQFFTDTCLDSFDDHKNVFSFSNERFDIATKDWLSNIANVIKFDAVAGLKESLSNLKDEADIKQQQIRPIYDFESDDSLVQDIYTDSLNLLYSNEDALPHPFYIQECITLIEEIDMFLSYLFSKDYKRAMNYLMFPLIRHARLVEYSNTEFEILVINKKQNKQQISAIQTRWKPLNDEATRAEKFVEECWKDPKFDSFNHVDMANHVLQQKDKNQKLIFSLLSEQSGKKRVLEITKRVAKLLGKKIKGL